MPVLGAAASCAFEGLLASCHKTLGGIPVQATAVINHCHEPIDITFILQSSHDYNVGLSSSQESALIQTYSLAFQLKQTRRIPPISWQYTYVTANDRPESRDIPGTGRRVMLHIAAKTVVKDPTEKVPKSAKVKGEAIRKNTQNMNKCAFVGVCEGSVPARRPGRSRVSDLPRRDGADRPL